jgi:hypothetical protein
LLLNGAVNIEINEYGIVVGMRRGRGIQRSQRKPTPVPLIPPPQIPHDLESNPGSRDEKLATNLMSYGTVWILLNLSIEIMKFLQNVIENACVLPDVFLFIQNNGIRAIFKGIFMP